MEDEYFAMQAGPPGVAQGLGRYFDVDAIAPVEFARGLAFRPVLGERLLVNFVRYDPHSVAPMHAHEEEQVTFVVEGEFEFDLDGDVRTMRAGNAVLIPPHVPHGARTLDTPCFEIDVFSPPRRALIEAARRAAATDAVPNGGTESEP